MQEGTHYLLYHCIVESGYTSQVSTFLDNQHEDQDDFIHAYPKNEQNSDYFKGNAFVELDKYSTECSNSQLQRFLLQYRYTGNQQGNDYSQFLLMCPDKMHNEELPEEILPATLSPQTANINTDYDIQTLPNIFNLFDHVLLQPDTLLPSYLYDPNQSLIQATIDMLTLVIFIILLKRWLQFDVLGAANGGNSDLFLENGGSRGVARYRQRRRNKEPSKLRWENNGKAWTENSDICQPRLPSSSNRSSVPDARNRSCSSYSSRSSIFDENNSNPETIEISISDESLFVASSSFSLTEEDDITNTENDESDSDQSSLNFYAEEKVDSAQIKHTQSAKYCSGEICQSQCLSQSSASNHRENYLLKDTNEPHTDNDEIDLISTNGSLDDEYDKDYDISELSWFVERYPTMEKKQPLPKHYSKRQSKTCRFFLCIIELL